MENEKKRSFPETLNEDIHAFRAAPDERSYSRILSRFFDGVEKDVSVPVPADMEWDTMKIKPCFYVGRDGEKSLVILSDPDGEKYPFFADVKLRAVLRIMMDADDCGGIVINPEEDTQVFIMKGVILNAFGAVIALLEEKEDAEQENEQTICRPIDEQLFERISEQIHSFRENSEDELVLDMEADGDDLLFIRAARRADMCRLELGFDMSDFNWEHPLILGCDMPLGEALDLLHRLLVDGESVDDIEVIQTEFRNMDGGEEKEQK